jgi:hypothetical protein
VRSFILGTDWWSDCDDAIAVRLLTRAVKNGQIQLLGININACMTYSVASLKGFLKSEGLSDIPVGIDPAATDFTGRALYQKRLAESLCPTVTNADGEDAVRLYRRLLTAAVGILAAFITALFLYAFGELVESSQENRDINRQILQTLGGNAPQAPQQAPQYAPQYTPQQSAPAAPQRVKPTPVPSGDTTPGVWYCRSCGNATSNAYATCTQCGLPKSR